jgi:hypothetical protein
VATGEASEVESRSKRSSGRMVVAVECGVGMERRVRAVSALGLGCGTGWASGTSGARFERARYVAARRDGERRRIHRGGG